MIEEESEAMERAQREAKRGQTGVGTHLRGANIPSRGVDRRASFRPFVDHQQTREGSPKHTYLPGGALAADTPACAAHMRQIVSQLFFRRDESPWLADHDICAGDLALGRWRAIPSCQTHRTSRSLQRLLVACRCAARCACSLFTMPKQPAHCDNPFPSLPNISASVTHLSLPHNPNRCSTFP